MGRAVADPVPFQKVLAHVNLTGENRVHCPFLRMQRVLYLQLLNGTSLNSALTNSHCFFVA